jgi:MerR family transcriptional regulator, mercuric resistance operon regulatory protein
VRTGEVAAKAGVNVQTLRFYERRGLVPKPPRARSGYRTYPAEAVATIRFVKRAQGLGFTLDEIAELLHLADGGLDDCEPTRALAEARMTELAHKITDLQRMHDSLAELVATCDRPRADRHCPLLRALRVDRGQPR